MTRSLKGASWNLKIGRKPADVVAEVVALMATFKLDFLAVCEASTYVKALAASPALRKAGVKVVAYPKGDVPARETALLVRKKTSGGPGAWGKKLHDITSIRWERDPSNRSRGLHPGRKSVSAHVGWLHVLAVHTPPGPFGPNFPLRHRANLDAFSHHEQIAHSWSSPGALFSRRALHLGDWNRHPGDPVVTHLTDATGWTVTGDGIDWSLGRNVTLTGVHRPHFGGSDHWPVVFTVAPKVAAPKPPPAPAVRHGFMPGAVVDNIPPGSNDPPILPCGVIQHVAVSNATSLRSIFTDGRGIESHFYVLKDGTIIQYRSIFFEADAQFAGNSFFLGTKRVGFVSVEHQGGVGADLNVPMPAAQLEAFHRVVKWVHSQAPFPLRVCPTWNSPGVGYHALHEEWNTNHHSCPGPARIKQFRDVTMPWLAAGAK